MFTTLFDLDNCLFETGSLGKEFLKPIEKLLLKHYSTECVASAISDMWAMALPDVVRKFGLEHIQVELEEMYLGLQIPASARLYSEVPDCLLNMQSRQWNMHLVTKGYRTFQMQKVAVTDLERFFPKVRIVSTEVDCYPTKRSAFEHIIRNLSRSDHKRTWVIGDGEEELVAGKQLGLRTIQTLRPGVPKRTADHHIHSLKEALALD